MIHLYFVGYNDRLSLGEFCNNQDTWRNTRQVNTSIKRHLVIQILMIRVLFQLLHRTRSLNIYLLMRLLISQGYFQIIFLVFLSLVPTSLIGW